MPLSAPWVSFAAFTFLLINTSYAHGPEFPELLSFGRTELAYGGAGRKLTELAWAPLRIHVHTEELEADISDTRLLKYVKDDLLPATMRYLSETLKVRPVQGNLQFEQQCLRYRGGRCTEISQASRSCGESTIPDSHLRDLEVCTSSWFSSPSCSLSQGGAGIPDADLAMYVRASRTTACSSGAAAYAGSCRQDTNDRPIAGFINICELQFELHSDVALLLHETLHALGFTSSMFAFYRDDDGAPRTTRDRSGFPPYDRWNGRYIPSSNTLLETSEADGTLKHYLALPRVVNAARQHFGCRELDRMPLEEAGGDGSAYSHWDERAMHTEVMSAQLSMTPKISNITLAVLEDSGWYKPVYTNVGQFHFGRNKGCAFLSSKCVDNGATQFPDTFCTVSTTRICGSYPPPTLGCTHDLLGKALCDTCVHSNDLPSKFQYFPGNSRLGGSGAFIGFCPVWVPFPTQGGDSYCTSDASIGNSATASGESFGSNSRCILSTAWSPNYFGAPSDARGSCRETKCLETGVAIRVADHWVQCEIADEGKQVAAGSGWSGHVVCPSYSVVCGAHRPRADSQSVCHPPSWWLHGRCVCAPGFLNEDCTVEDTMENRGKYPHGLLYASHELVLEVGDALPEVWQIEPKVSGISTGLDFSITPQLPSGLSIHPSSGVISGSPMMPVDKVAYIVRAGAGSGAATVTIFITVSCPSGGGSDCGQQSATSAPALPITASPALPITASSIVLSTSSPQEASTSPSNPETTAPPSTDTVQDVVNTSGTGATGTATGAGQGAEQLLGAEQAEVSSSTSLLEQKWFRMSLVGLALVICLCSSLALLCICRRKCGAAEHRLPYAVDSPPRNPVAPGTSGQTSSRMHSSHPHANRVANPRMQSTGRAASRDDRVSQMLEMGFEFEVAVAALERHAWDVNRAATALAYNRA